MTKVPPHLAVESGSANLRDHLLAFGANVEAHDSNGWRAIHEAYNC